MTDPVGTPVDPVSTIPPTEPAMPTVASLMSAKARIWTYAILGVLNAVWTPLAAVIVTQTDNVWAAVIPSIVLGALSAMGFTLSGGNVPVTRTAGPRASGI